MIIGFGYKSGSGKDTCAKITQCLILNKALIDLNEEPVELLTFLDRYDYYDKYECATEHKKFATKVKEVAAVLLDAKVSEFEEESFKKSALPTELQSGEVKTVRQFLQHIGNSFRTYNPDFWVNALFSDYNEWEEWVISDVRFPNEALKIRELGGIVLRVDGNHREDEDVSENALDGFTFDGVIDNSGDFDFLARQLKKYV